MSRTYSRVDCSICGRTISSAGLAHYNHMMKHVRAKEANRLLATSGKYMFTITNIGYAAISDRIARAEHKREV